MPTSQSELLRRLDDLRRTIRRRLIGYGVCAVAAGGFVAFLTIVALDWLLWLPPALRVLGAVLFIGGSVVSAWYWVGRPLRTRLELPEIAARLERHFVALSDRLSSAVSFSDQLSGSGVSIEGTESSSAAMMHQVIVDTERLLSELELKKALSLRPLTVRVVWLATAGIALGIVAVVAPTWLGTGVARYAAPFGEVEWPRRTRIVPLSENRLAAVGESVALRIRIDRGDSDSLRGLVRLRESEGQVVSLTLQRDTDGSLYTTVDAVSKDLEYWFEAGDDSTEANPFSITVVPRPEVVHAIAAVEPPSYAAGRGESVHDLTGGPVTAVIGGAVRITLRCSKPVPADPTGTHVGLRAETGALIPLSVGAADGTELVARIPVSEDVRLRPELRDAHGFENRGAATYEIHAVPDAAPTVTILEPPAAAEATPKGAVRIVARVSDDFGLRDLSLHAETASGRQLAEVPLMAGLRVTPSESGVEATTEHRVLLEPFGLSAGDIVNVVLTATDNYTPTDADNGTGSAPHAASGERVIGQTKASSPLRISIIGEAEFDTRLRSDIAVLEARLRQVALDQADTLDRTQTLQTSAQGDQGLSDAQRQSASSLANNEVRLARRVREMAQRFQKLAERLEGGDSSDPENRNRLLSITRSLREVADDPMAEAGAVLTRAAESSAPEEQAKAIRDAIRNEERAAGRIQNLIRSMSQWGSFQGLLAKAGDLLDRQTVLRDETAALGKRMLGKPLDTLTPEESADLKRALRRQEQLSADVEQLLARMEQLRSASQEKDASVGEAIEAAQRAARTHELSKRLSNAAEAIRENRTAAASMEQKAATDALRKLASALREREERELAQLQKRLQQAEEQLALLIRDEEAVRAASNEAGLVAADANAFAKLDAEQGRIRRNTISLAEEIGSTERAAQPARAIRQATPPMTEAEGHLRTQKATPAVAAQDLALGALREGLDRLERLSQDAANEVVRRSLAQIREDLQSLRTVQAEINQGIARLAAAVSARDRMERAQAREASNLAREQAGARAQAEAIGPDLEKVVVYRWAMERVTRWMDSAQRSLDARRIDRDLVTTTDRVVRELDKLIGAIEETEALPASTDFVEADAGGEGSADPSGAKAVPTVAELLVLRTMQTDVNDRTRGQLSDANDSPTEAGLEELKAIGEDQAEVRRLTELVTNRARQP